MTSISGVLILIPISHSSIHHFDGMSALLHKPGSYEPGSYGSYGSYSYKAG